MPKTASRRTKPDAGVPDVPLDDWRRLYEAAGRVRALQPWTWMYETDLFGVQDPRSQDLYFASVMGERGEYHAIALYRGAEAVTRFWAAHEYDDEALVIDLTLGTYQLHVSFGGRDDLEAHDRRLFKDLDLKFRGDTAWPVARSRRPGHTPWFLEDGEARILADALEQLLDVAPRVQRDRSLVHPEAREHEYLVRVPVGEGSAIAWRDELRVIPPAQTSLMITIPDRLMGVVQGLSESQARLQVDVSYTRSLIGKRGERPKIAFLLLAVEPDSGLVISANTFVAEPTWDAMWAGVPEKVLSALERLGVRPRLLVVKSRRLHSLLKPFTDKLGIQLERAPHLKALEAARRSFEQFAGLR